MSDASSLIVLSWLTPFRSVSLRARKKSPVFSKTVTINRFVGISVVLSVPLRELFHGFSWLFHDFFTIRHHTPFSDEKKIFFYLYYSAFSRHNSRAHRGNLVEKFVLVFSGFFGISFERMYGFA